MRRLLLILALLGLAPGCRTLAAVGEAVAYVAIEVAVDVAIDAAVGSGCHR